MYYFDCDLVPLEQQFGNFQRTEDMEKYKRLRHEFGRFYYRFPDGESGLDVFGRVASFIGTLFRFLAQLLCVCPSRKLLCHWCRDWANEPSIRGNRNTTIIVRY